ncbi:MAG: hypothetical protein JWM82_787 [Myxococcales bacterium]|nr:hypothetical protein [Myxococcales bacterium]
MNPRNDNHLKLSSSSSSSSRPTAAKALDRRPPRRAPRRRPVSKSWAPAILATFFLIGCSDDFDSTSLVESTRVVGARVEVANAPDRASPAPGETATVTWFVTAPAATPPLAWAFALCKPAPGGTLGCGDVPFAVFQGTGAPKVTLTLPAADALAGLTHVALFGRVCDDAAPIFDPSTGNPSCASGHGTTASLSIRVQTTADANHNPTAERGFTFDGQPWPALAAGADPCVAGPRIAADEKSPHELGFSTAGADRESYATMTGDPPVATTAREALQVSLFTTTGKLKSPFAFIEAADARDTTPLTMKWTPPKAVDVAKDTPVTFTFVVRDDRGGADWTTRAACVTP